MKIYVLADNHASRNYPAQWGLSLFIESSKRLLFDFGSSDQLTERAIDYMGKLNIERISPSHCTEFDALVQFANAFGSKPFTL